MFLCCNKVYITLHLPDRGGKRRNLSSILIRRFKGGSETARVLRALHPPSAKRVSRQQKRHQYHPNLKMATSQPLLESCTLTTHTLSSLATILKILNISINRKLTKYTFHHLSMIWLTQQHLLASEYV